MDKRRKHRSTEVETSTECTSALSALQAHCTAEERRRDLFAQRALAWSRILDAVDACTEHSGRWPGGQGRELVRGLVDRWAVLARAIRDGTKLLGPLRMIIYRSDSVIYGQCEDGLPMNVSTEQLIFVQIPSHVGAKERARAKFVRDLFKMLVDAPDDPELRQRIVKDLVSTLDRAGEEVSWYTLYFRLLRSEYRRHYSAVCASVDELARSGEQDDGEATVPALEGGIAVLGSSQAGASGPGDSVASDRLASAEPSIVALEQTVPAYDLASGDWVSLKTAGELEGIKPSSLGTYRRQGTQSPDKMSGRDKYGRLWRRTGTPSSHPHYLRRTLRSVSKSSGSPDEPEP